MIKHIQFDNNLSVLRPVDTRKEAQEEYEV